MRGRHLAADAIALLTGVVTLLVTTQIVQPGGDRCGGTSITVWSSVEPGKASLLNTSGVVQRAGATYPCVRVVPISSGVAEAALEKGGWSAGTGEPDVWLPTDSLWAQVLRTRTGITARSLGSVTGSPMQVVAAKDLVRTLGWEGRTELAWPDLKAAAESGRLKLVKENALNSTSGAMATLLAYEAAAGGPLTVDAVTRGDLDGFTGPIERAVGEYPGEITQFLHGIEPNRSVTDRVNIMIVQRAMYRQYKLGDRFTEFSLTGPDPMTDHPYVLRPGLSTAKTRLARRFHEDLIGSRWQDELRKRHFDPPVRTTSAAPGTHRDGAVVDAVLKRWRDHLRRRVQLAILLDQSGSISALTGDLRRTLDAALSRLSDNDRVAIMGFPDAYLADLEPLVPKEGFESPRTVAARIPPMATNRSATPLVEAIAKAGAEAVRGRPSDDPDNPKTPAVLVITDGRQRSTGTPGQLARAIADIHSMQERDGLRVYVVLAGDEALQKVEEVTGDAARAYGIPLGQPLIATLAGGGTTGGTAGAESTGSTAGTASTAGAPIGSQGDKVYCISGRKDCLTAGSLVVPVQERTGPDQGRTKAIIDSIIRQLGG